MAIGGPTGSGKSQLGVLLATEFAGEIVNCDSLQVYRHFDIGTAKLSPAERGSIPHYLIDVADAAEGFTAADFVRLAREALAAITARGRLPIIVGGTGFYLRALLDGLSPAPPRDEALRQRLAAREALRPGSLHRLLRRLDRISATRIHARDTPKLIRALEIRLLSGAKPSGQAARQGLEGYRVQKIGLFPPRDELYLALDRRSERILTCGLLEEVEHLLAAGVARTAKPFESIGYKEALALLEGRLSFSEALEQMQRETRRYAKRQVTWFRHEPGILPLPGFGGDPVVQTAAREATLGLMQPARD